MREGITSDENWIADLPADIRAQIYARCEEVTLAAGEMLHARGTLPLGMYQIERGFVRLLGQQEGGNSKLLIIYGPGNTFHESPLLGHRAMRHSTVAITTASLRLLRTPDFWTLYHAHREIADALACKFADQIGRLLAVHEMRTSIRLGRNIALAFENLVERCGRPYLDGAVAIDLPLTQSDLAGHFAVTRQSIQREISRLKRAAILAKEGATWLVLDRERLRRFDDPRSAPGS